MNKKLLLITTSLFACSISGVAQITPAAQSGVGVAGSVVNTGVSVAPNIQHYAVVYDEPGGPDYKINWLDDAGAIVDSDNGLGSDPDVAYYRNADLLFVTYTNGGDVYIDDYYLSTLSPLNYNLGSTNGVAGGVYPNIDCNSDGRGVLCWQNGSDIYACSFYPGLTLGPPTLIASGAQTPDVVLLDNSDEFVITYTTLAGDIYIRKYDYYNLTLGLANLNNQWMYNGAGSLGFAYPRIAASRNANFANADNFTVTSEYHSTSGQNYIVGFFYNTGSFNATLINNGATNCDNNKPVVTYERNEVHIAWASNADGACSSLGGGLGDNILLSEHKFDGTDLAPGVLYEVNNWSNSFVDASPSITAEYDGGYGITNANYHEAIVYNDAGDLFWKARNTGTPTSFKQASVEDIGSDNIFLLAENPVQDYIYVVGTSDAEATFVLYDNLGKRILLDNITNTKDHYQIDINGLPQGIYYLECKAGRTSETIKIVH